MRTNLTERSVSTVKILAHTLVSLRRGPKKVILASIDFASLAALLWIVISARYGEFYVPSGFISWALFLLAPSLSVAAIAHHRMYHEVTRYLSARGLSLLWQAVLGALVTWCAAVFVVGQAGVPRSSAVVFTVTAPALVVLLRQIAARYLHWAGIVVPDALSRPIRKTAIVLGSGRLAVRYLQSDLTRNTSVVALLDGASSQVGRSVHGVRVQHWDRLSRILDRDQVAEAIIASDNLADPPLVEALKSLRAKGVLCRVYTETAVSQDATRKRFGLREFEIRDVLPRSVVPPDVVRLRETFRGARVLITGAGGSIGSELVMQVLNCAPEMVVLLDNSEVGLHRITLKSQDLVNLSGSATVIKPVLASVTDERRIDGILSTCQIDTIFHAAAVKHVPLLEAEPEAAVINNILGTRIVAHAAGHHKVRRFVLVSTDKAVRPSSVMGATKRAAELVVSEASDLFVETIYSSVRFGNVLGSSGSVVERFTEQIRAGGPVTVTHPEMTRYFMTVEEAAGLVMEAGALAKGGETFILDMGASHGILDLAKTMIGLMGYTVRSEDNPNGEIEIKFTGMRPGEKLNEELMVDAGLAVGTAHPKISMLPHESVSKLQIQSGINRLKQCIEDGDQRKIVLAVNALIAGYSDDPKIIDLNALRVTSYVH